MKDNEILKKTLLHYINLEYYANGIDEEFQTLLSELEERCFAAISSQPTINTKLSYSTIMKLIKEEVERYRNELEERLEEEAERVLQKELEFLDNTYNNSMNEGAVKGSLLALGGIAVSRLLFAPIAGNETVHNFADKTSKNIFQAYDTSLRAGYLFGQSSDDIKNQIQEKMPQIRKGIKSGIQTAVPSFAKTTDRVVFLNNNVEVVWVATLDGRTCINCAALSGLHFKSITEAPSIPLHWGCRCIVQMADRITEPIPNFEEFIEMLDEEEQIHVLGRGRFELWKQYGVELRKFTNNGAVIPYEKLDTSKYGIKSNAEKSLEAAKQLFPKENWTEKDENIFVANSRNIESKNEKAKFEKEFNQAKILSQKGHVVYMPPELGKGKHYDAIVDGVKTEFKAVTGNRNAIGHNYSEAIKQGHDVFIRITQEETPKSIYSKLIGTTKALLIADKNVGHGKVYVWVEKEQNLRIWNMESINEKAKESIEKG